jgi:hypothetical protein
MLFSHFFTDRLNAEHQRDFHAAAARTRLVPQAETTDPDATRKGSALLATLSLLILWLLLHPRVNFAVAALALVGGALLSADHPLALVSPSGGSAVSLDPGTTTHWRSIGGEP